MVSTRIIIAGAVALVVVGAVGALGSGGLNTTERATTATTTTNKVGTVRLCGRDDLTAEIDIRRPSRVLQPPGPGAFAPSVRRPVATVVVRNPGTHRCLLSSGVFDLTIRDRTGKTVMGRWDGPWFGGTYSPGSGKPFSLPDVYTCDRQGPFIAEATVITDATVKPITTRRDNLTRREITC